MVDGTRDPNARGSGDKVVIDLERLEAHARTLYLHRFVEAIGKAREQHGRYLYLRSGDEIAISAAGDGSAELLERLKVDAPREEHDL
ncbi:MAG: hypothetical protein GEU78_06615 [Actinobacteria bacterium]|nr:hypothetical protein [Actinomycetota bacterium]